MNAVSLNCSFADYLGYLFIYGWSAAMLFGGSIAGYISRHKNDKRRFTTSVFLGEMFISVFIGMVFLSLSIWSGFIKLINSASSWEFIKVNGLGITLVAVGSYFSPLIIAIVERKIQEKLGPWLDRNLHLPEVAEENEVKK